MSRKPSSAFVTTRKGFCYLTVKVGRSNFNIMRIRNYTLEPQDKRDMRRLYPDYLFDWKKIGQQLADKRQVCRAYRSKRQAPGARNAHQTRSSWCRMTQGRARFTHPTPAIQCHCLTPFCTWNAPARNSPDRQCSRLLIFRAVVF